MCSCSTFSYFQSFFQRDIFKKIRIITRWNILIYPSSDVSENRRCADALSSTWRDFLVSQSNSIGYANLSIKWIIGSPQRTYLSDFLVKVASLWLPWHSRKVPTVSETLNEHCSPLKQKENNVIILLNCLYVKWTRIYIICWTGSSNWRYEMTLVCVCVCVC